MERIIILTRTTKKEGNIKLRFRLYDGRDFELFHFLGEFSIAIYTLDDHPEAEQIKS